MTDPRAPIPARSATRSRVAGGLLVVFGALPLGAQAGTVPPAQARATWPALLEGTVVVHCGEWKASMWCQAEARLPADVDAVLALMADVEDLPALFPRMLSMERVAPEVLHQVIDYPFPYDDRDIVARFTWTHAPGHHTLRWSSVPTPAVRSVGVRLTGAEGQFELQARDDGHTDLTYVWRGDLGPGVPAWVHPFAWKNQAREVVEGLTAGLTR